MMKFNALQFVNNLSADLAGEFDELEEMIQKGEDAEGIRRVYNHLGSMIQGFEYMAEFIEDEDDRKELTAILAQKREERDGFYPRAASIVYSKKLGRKVIVTWCHHTEAPDEFVVVIDDCARGTFHKTEEVKACIDELAKGEA